MTKWAVPTSLRQLHRTKSNFLYAARVDLRSKRGSDLLCAKTDAKGRQVGAESRSHHPALQFQEWIEHLFINANGRAENNEQVRLKGIEPCQILTVDIKIGDTISGLPQQGLKRAQILKVNMPDRNH